MAQNKDFLGAFSGIAAPVTPPGLGDLPPALTTSVFFCCHNSQGTETNGQEPTSRTLLALCLRSTPAEQSNILPLAG